MGTLQLGVDGRPQRRLGAFCVARVAKRAHEIVRERPDTREPYLEHPHRERAEEPRAALGARCAAASAARTREPTEPFRIDDKLLRVWGRGSRLDLESES
tara:strand:+ start:157 stop:456 length:300 start_codon:yes stop_codon:yes gene_type:complete